MGLVSEFWKLLEKRYEKLNTDVKYVQKRTQDPLQFVPKSTLAIAMDAMDQLHIRNSTFTQTKIETLEGFETVLFNTVSDMLLRDLRILAFVIMFDKATPNGKCAHKPRYKDPIADPIVPSNSIGEQAWFEFYRVSDSVDVRCISGNNRVNTETRLDITENHMGNRGFKQFLITLFCNGLRKNKDKLMLRRRCPFTICVRGHGTNNFELYWDGASDSVQVREPTLSKSYYQEAEMGMSAAVCDLISLGYNNIVVFSNDGDTFGPLALTIPKRTNEHGTSYVAKLHWITRTQVFDVNAWHALEERLCQAHGLEYGVYFSLVHYVALIIGGGNDYVKKLEKISAGYVIDSLDKETYTKLLQITQSEDRIEIHLDEIAFERLVHNSYAKKRESGSGRSKLRPLNIDSEKIGEMYRNTQWYLDYLIAGFIGEPTAFPSH